MDAPTTTVWSIGVARPVHDALVDRLPELSWDWFADSATARQQLSASPDDPAGALVLIASYDADDAWSLLVGLSQIAARPSTELREVLLLGEGPMSRFPVHLTDHPRLRLVVDDASALDYLATRIAEIASPSMRHQPKGIAS